MWQFWLNSHFLPTYCGQKVVVLWLLRKVSYLNMQERPQDYYFTHFVPRVVIATENGYLEKSPWGNFPGRPSLDSLLGMEGNDVRKMEKIPGSVNLSLDLTYLNDLSKTNNLLETQAYTIPLPFTLEQFVFVISP
jgi:hypothetical protein